MDTLGNKKLNPLDHDRKHLVVDCRSLDPKYDGLSAEEQFQRDKEAIEIMEEKGILGHYQATIRIQRTKHHLLGLQRDLAEIACHQTGGVRRSSDQ